MNTVTDYPICKRVDNEALRCSEKVKEMLTNSHQGQPGLGRAQT